MTLPPPVLDEIVTAPRPPADPVATAGARDGAALGPLAAAFAVDGYVGPIAVFTRQECRRIAAYLGRSGHASTPDWEKGRAVRERFLFELATRPVLLSLVRTFLGEDVILWGVSALVRAPGVSHPWHSDIESCAAEGGFVTAWIGIEHTTRESALELITRSHRLGATVQQVRQRIGLRRELATAQLMMEAARVQDPSAALVQPDMTDGDALLFDGRLWHGSLNRRKHGHRLALLIQYASARCPVRIPDFSRLDWPFRMRPAPRPPVIVVSGRSRLDTNRIVPAPPLVTTGRQMITTAIHSIELPIDPASDWQPFQAFCGPTAALLEMSCHASTLAPGRSPHPPHAHLAEELLIPLRGEVELVIAAGPDDPSPRRERVDPGCVAYYPAGQHHTIHNVGRGHAGYLMFKWRAGAVRRPTGGSPLGVVLCRDAHTIGDRSTSVAMRRLFEGPTSFLTKLHAHVTALEAGAGYEPHVDAYDVAILTLAGSVETLGERVEPGSVIYYAAGEPHGMRNVGTGTARYLVFEFHGAASDPFLRGSMVRRQAARVLRVAKRLARGAWLRMRAG